MPDRFFIFFKLIILVLFAWGANPILSVTAQAQTSGNEEAFQKVLSEAVRAIENASDDIERSAALFRLGRIQFATGRFSAALKAYDQSLMLRQRLLDGNPSSARRKLDVIVSLTGVGDVQLKLGDFSGALPTYEYQMGIVRDLLATIKTPGVQADIKGLLLISFHQLGDAQMGLDMYADGLASYQSAVDISRDLVDSDPGSAERQYTLAESLLKLSDAQFIQKSNEEFEATLRESLDILRPLAASGHSPGEVHRDLVTNLYKLGVITKNQAHYREALDVILAMQNHGILAASDAWKVADLKGLAAGFTKDICPALSAALKYSENYFSDIIGDLMYPDDGQVLIRKTSLEPSWARGCSASREGFMSEWSCDVEYETTEDGSKFFDSPSQNAFDALKEKVQQCLDAGWERTDSKAGSPIQSVLFSKAERTITLMGFGDNGYISVSRRVESE